MNCIKTLKISQKSSFCCKIFYKNSASIQIMEDVTVVTKNDRQSQELAMLLGNEHRMKNYARSVALNSLYHPVERPRARYSFNKNGDQIQTEESIKQQEAWDRCKARCHGEDLPTLWDVMMEGQAFEAITNSNNFVALRDTAGLKPIDESKMVVQPDNPLSNMSMEQLELLNKIGNLDPEKVQKLLEQVDGNV